MMTIVLGSAAVLKPMHKRVVRNFAAPADTGKKEKPRFPGTDNNYDPTDIDPPQNLQLKDPANLKTDIEYDFKTGNYEFEQKL